MLAARLLGIDVDAAAAVGVSVTDAADSDGTCSGLGGPSTLRVHFDAAPGTPFPLGSGLAATVLPNAGPLHPARRTPTAALAVPLRAGHCTRVCVAPVSPTPATPALPPPSPFPPLAYPAQFLGADTATQGTWIGKYGSAGYALFAFDGAGASGDLVKLPSYVAAVQQTFGHAENGPWPTTGNDTRALQVWGVGAWGAPLRSTSSSSALCCACCRIPAIPLGHARLASTALPSRPPTAGTPPSRGMSFSRLRPRCAWRWRSAVL